MKQRQLFTVFFVFAPLLAILLISAQIYYIANIWSYQGDAIRFEIKPGEPFSSINHRLSSEQIIKNAKVFHRYSQFTGVMEKFKNGLYEITPGMTTIDVVALLTSGKSILVKITIPEGKNMYEIANILENESITKASEFLKLTQDRLLLKKLEIPFPSVEGYLYPDTYYFTPYSQATVIIEKMVKTFHQKWKSLNLSGQTLNAQEILILASIVEKETGVDFERPRIAGVFFNRLKKGIRLQSDPTTIYGLYPNYSGNLRKKDLQEKTHYNTYQIKGLPIGPICNPGLDAMKAVMSPEKHEFLFFVSQNDGTHVFSKTYQEHNQAVQTYQLNIKNRQGKSWRDYKKKTPTPVE